jgi:hypothetical protein
VADHLTAKVAIMTDTGSVEFVVRVPAALSDLDAQAEAERKIRKVLAAGVEMGIALLDADYMKTEEGESIG